MTSPAAALSVIKIGGGLAAIPGALDRVCRAVGASGCDHRILVVPGGGPFADAVREFDRVMGVSPDAAHWMAILAMDQYAHVLADRIPGAALIEEPGALSQTFPSGAVAVLAPSRWMRSADVLPHSWEVTSDSIAAFVAGALDAARLILIKPPTELSDPVDSHFATALPAGMPYSILGCDHMDELARRLSE
jgi:5-(aminomethyl)-3-furanmethanol phosphate kinase